ncbi:MAG: hypothetical protein WC276_06910 [Sedimentibacter sp.]
MEELGVIQLGKIAYESGLFKDIRNPEQAVIKILKGQELGLPPITALESIFVIDGRIALSSSLIASRIKTSGKYDYKTTEKTPKRVVIEFYENGKKVGESSFGEEEAKRAGIMDSWGVQKYPEDTFWARALTRGARTYCPDVFQGGSIYVAEELIREKTVEKSEKKPVEKPQSNERTVTNKQVNYLWVKAKEKALDSNSLVKLVKEQTGKNELKDMTYSDFNKVLGLIEAM